MFVGLGSANTTCTEAGFWQDWAGRTWLAVSSNPYKPPPLRFWQTLRNALEGPFSFQCSPTTSAHLSYRALALAPRPALPFTCSVRTDLLSPFSSCLFQMKFSKSPILGVLTPLCSQALSSHWSCSSSAEKSQKPTAQAAALPSPSCSLPNFSCCCHFIFFQPSQKPGRFFLLALFLWCPIYILHKALTNISVSHSQVLHDSY